MNKRVIRKVVIGNMDRRNVICPECGKRFHACSSCGLPHNYLFYYCSDKCYIKSLTFNEKKRRESKNDIYKLDDLSYYLQEECEDELMLLLNDNEIRLLMKKRHIKK